MVCDYGLFVWCKVVGSGWGGNGFDWDFIMNYKVLIFCINDLLSFVCIFGEGDFFWFVLGEFIMGICIGEMNDLEFYEFNCDVFDIGL